MTADERIEQLEQRVADLEAEVAAAAHATPASLRAERLVVVDGQGVERIVLDARHATGSVLVKLAGRDGATTGVEIYASEAETGPPEVGLCVVRDGDVVSRWTAG